IGTAAVAAAVGRTRSVPGREVRRTADDDQDLDGNSRRVTPDAVAVDGDRDVRARDHVHGDRYDLRARLSKGRALRAVLHDDNVVPTAGARSAHEQDECTHYDNEQDQHACSGEHSYL